MNKKRYLNRNIVKDILAGGEERDQTLKYLLLSSGYSEIVYRIVKEEGGGEKEKAEDVFEDCLITLDRKIRRYEIKEDDSLTGYFEEEAKHIWSEKLQQEKITRDKVLKWVNEDNKLRQQIYQAIMKNSGKSEDAEDCYQNGIILLDSKLKEGKYNGGAMKGFFYQLCFNLWRNELKRSKPQPIDNNELNKPVTKEDPARVLEKKELALLLNHLFEKLGESCKKMMQLKYFIIDKYTMDEIAVQMGYKNAQIASNALSKCRKRLWELMQEHKQEISWKNCM